MRLAMILALLAGPAMAAGQDAGQPAGQPYAGQETREIPSLSAEDIAALEAGEGWGLAKPAELNGYPGPAHVLELAEDLALTDAQLAEVQAIHDAMKAEARRLGRDYITAEAHVAMLFREGHARPETLEGILGHSGRVLAELRAVHLKAHIATTPLLTAEQRETYDRLRGYGGADHDMTGHSGHGDH